MEVKAHTKYLRMSPRKVRLVIDVIRGLGVRQAQAQLMFMKKIAAEPVKKLLDSAIANAEHNFSLTADKLYVKAITADGGPILGRWRARAFGRAASIRKRSTHLSIVLSEKGEKKQKAKKESKKNDKESSASALAK